MNKDLNASDLDFILESLKYTRKAFEEYDRYPDYEFKQKRLAHVNDVMEKIRSLKRSF